MTDGQRVRGDRGAPSGASAPSGLVGRTVDSVGRQRRQRDAVAARRLDERGHDAVPLTGIDHERPVDGLAEATGRLPDRRGGAIGGVGAAVGDDDRERRLRVGASAHLSGRVEPGGQRRAVARREVLEVASRPPDVVGRRQQHVGGVAGDGDQRDRVSVLVGVTQQLHRDALRRPHRPAHRCRRVDDETHQRLGVAGPDRPSEVPGFHAVAPPLGGRPDGRAGVDRVAGGGVRALRAYAGAAAVGIRSGVAAAAARPTPGRRVGCLDLRRGGVTYARPCRTRDDGRRLVSRLAVGPSVAVAVRRVGVGSRPIRAPGIAVARRGRGVVPVSGRAVGGGARGFRLRPGRAVRAGAVVPRIAVARAGYVRLGVGPLGGTVPIAAVPPVRLTVVALRVLGVGRVLGTVRVGVGVVPVAEAVVDQFLGVRRVVEGVAAQAVRERPGEGRPHVALGDAGPPVQRGERTGAPCGRDIAAVAVDAGVPAGLDDVPDERLRERHCGEQVTDVVDGRFRIDDSGIRRLAVVDRRASIVEPAERPLHHGDAVVCVSQTGHLDGEIEPVAKLGAEVALLGVHRSDQGELGGVGAGDAVALDPVDAGGGGVQQHVDEVVVEQVHLVDVQHPAVRAGEQPRLERRLAVERVGDRQRADDRLACRSERERDERRRVGRDRHARAPFTVGALPVALPRRAAERAVGDDAPLGERPRQRARQRRLPRPLLAAHEQPREVVVRADGHQRPLQLRLPDDVLERGVGGGRPARTASIKHTCNTTTNI